MSLDKFELEFELKLELDLFWKQNLTRISLNSFELYQN